MNARTPTERPKLLVLVTAGTRGCKIGVATWRGTTKGQSIWKRGLPLHSMPDRIEFFQIAQNHLKAYHNPAQLCQIVFLGASSQCSPATVMHTLETIFIHMLNASGNKPATPLTPAPSSPHPYYYWKVESLIISEQKTYTPKKLT